MNRPSPTIGPESSIDVSFLMTTYNFEAYVTEAVNSLLALETELVYEVIVLDDASKDQTWELLSRFSDPRLKIIRHETNQGVAIAINCLFTEARGRYIARIDGDDRWRSNFLELTIPVLAANEAVGLVYGDVAIMNSDGRITSPKGNLNRPDLPRQGNELLPLLETSYICAPAVIAKREAWQAVLPWPVNMGPGDWLGHLKMANAGWQFIHIDEVIADYRLHSEGMHVAYMQSNQGEVSTNKILDEMFALAQDKLSSSQQKRLRAQHHKHLAFSYIGQQRYNDAKRVLWSAIKNKPSLLFAKSVFVQFIALVIGYPLYLRIKKMTLSDRQ